MKSSDYDNKTELRSVVKQEELNEKEKKRKQQSKKYHAAIQTQKLKDFQQWETWNGYEKSIIRVIKARFTC